MKEKSFLALRGLIKRTFHPGPHLRGKGGERAEGGLIQNFQKRPLSPPSPSSSLPFSVLCVSCALRDIFPFLGNPRLIGLPSPSHRVVNAKARLGELCSKYRIHATYPSVFPTGHPVEEPDGRTEGLGQIFIVVVAEMRWKE